ncbi:hypothetical protein FRAAL0003 [Frankia alni ACN14a]|uniref:Uncharacterized protein n=1 Tax=Frankia alni (strain DSM 45986 / CECT 9034 / ACN14a) TaxID=326424 RepID=Q0RUQ3_FRAAA|nr:hypothetical protein FRAAL0003 [Frankia alni ACN14a]
MCYRTRRRVDLRDGCPQAVTAVPWGSPTDHRPADAPATHPDAGVPEPGPAAPGRRLLRCVLDGSSRRPAERIAVRPAGVDPVPHRGAASYVMGATAVWVQRSVPARPPAVGARESGVGSRAGARGCPSQGWRAWTRMRLVSSVTWL